MSPRLRTVALFLIFFLFIGSIIELFSLAMVIPILQVIIDPDALDNYLKYLPFNEYLITISERILLYIIVGSTVFIYIFKNFYLFAVQWATQKFLKSFAVHICDSLLKVYLKKNFLYFNEHNSAGFIKTLEKDVEGLNSNLGYLATVILEIFTIIFISILLFLVQPLGMISTISFYIIGAGAFMILVKKKTKIWATEKFFWERDKMKYLKQIVESIRDVKLLNLESFFLENFTKNNRNYFNVAMKNAIVVQTPRLWMEIITILAIFSLLAILLNNQNMVSSSILPVLGLYVASAFKLIPSFNKIVSSVQGLRFIKPAINEYYFEIFNSSKNEMKSNIEKNIIFKNKIEFKNISFSYNKKNIILNNISLTLSKGEKIGIFGDSGSGKSTFLDIFTGLVVPDSGEILVDGININLGINSWRKQFAYSSQNPILIDDTLKNNILLGSEKNYNLDMFKKSLRYTKLENFIDQLDKKEETIIGERGARISGGQKQRIGLAKVICLDRNILILDESTNAIDEENEKEILENIWKEYYNKSIIIVSHNKKNLEICDSVYEFTKNKLIKIK